MSIVSAWWNSLPIQTVDAVYRWASIVTIGAGVLTVIGSLGAYWASNRSRELDGLDNQRRDGQLKRLDFQRAQLEADLETEREHERMRVQIAEQRERERVVSTTTMADVSAYGLVLVRRQDTEVTAAVRGLLEALRAAGESPRVEVAPWAPDGYPQLLVGYRPIQPAGTR